MNSTTSISNRAARIVKRKPTPTHAQLMKSALNKLHFAPMDQTRYNCLTEPERRACLELLSAIERAFLRPSKSGRYPPTFCYQGGRYEVGRSNFGRVCIYSERTGQPLIASGQFFLV